MSNAMTNTYTPARRIGWPNLNAWLPLALLPSLVVACAWNWPAWAFMWALAFAIYAGLKWLTFAASPIARHTSTARVRDYLLLWPGMDADAFLDESRRVTRPAAAEILSAIAKLGVGVTLLTVSSRLTDVDPVLAGWMGASGVVMTLHFGLFHVISILWRLAGVEAVPLMHSPMLAHSLGDFWGARWNLAFRDVAHRFVFHPLHARVGSTAAMLAVFLVSGLVHDLVMSPAARGGWGLPTMYFLLQGAGVVIERSKFGRRVLKRHDILSRVFAGSVILAPLPLLLNRPFIDRVVVPMLLAWGANS